MPEGKRYWLTGAGELRDLLGVGLEVAHVVFLKFARVGRRALAEQTVAEAQCPTAELLQRVACFGRL